MGSLLVGWKGWMVRLVWDRGEIFVIIIYMLFMYICVIYMCYMIVVFVRGRKNVDVKSGYDKALSSLEKFVTVADGLADVPVQYVKDSLEQ